MIANLKRYSRAFFIALKFTLRGQKPPLLQVRDQHPQLAAWWDHTIVLTTALESAARAQGIDSVRLTIRADRRDVSMATILAAVRYHAESEYPYLLAQGDEYGSLTVQATNLNDRYLVMALENAIDERLKPSVHALSAHLALLPGNQ